MDQHRTLHTDCYNTHDFPCYKWCVNLLGAAAYILLQSDPGPSEFLDVPRHSEQHPNQAANDIHLHSEQHPDQRINGGQTTLVSLRHWNFPYIKQLDPLLETKNFQRAATSCETSIYFRTDFNSDVDFFITNGNIIYDKCNLVFKYILC